MEEENIQVPMPTEAQPEQIKINYRPPKFFRRLLADMIDLLVFAFIGVCIFLGIRQGVVSSSSYLAAQDRVVEVKKASGLFIDNSGTLTDAVTYWSKSKSLSGTELKNHYIAVIDDFIAYVGKDISVESQKKVQADYDSYRLADSLTYDGIKYFVTDTSGAIVENSACLADDKTKATSVYGPYIDNRAQGFLTTLNPSYLADTKYMSNKLLFEEIPISFVAAEILAFYVPGLFFRRGRKTLGKALYHIARVDSKCLNVSFGRYTAESAIFIFGIGGLSLVTLGVPLIVSFSLMAFSKNKQDFPDYMLGIREITDEDQKVYFSKEEILMETMKSDKKAVDFKMEDLSAK
jgi:hypothetical protein